MRASVLGFQEVDRTRIMDVGGKGASLGELSRLEGVRVPDGFCVSTGAFKRILGEAPSLGEWLDRLSRLKAEDREGVRELSAEIRGIIEGIAIPFDLHDAISRYLARLGEEGAYAVRSSATAEDLPTASFAGQQDTYLNVIGKPAILKHISRCWASLFTERAVIYRLRNGFDHRKVHMAVVVQKLIVPQAAGILFTADPVTSNRKVSSIEAGFGLGEALVSGLVNADGYKVRNGQVIEKAIATKKLSTWALKEGGTKELSIEPGRQNQPVLTEEQIGRLERLGRRIEGHFGRPQDIEWCLVEDDFYIVQSRPITTLFPIPKAFDQGNHVYVSVGHQQMMTDPMKPLGLSLFQLTAGRPMYEAGGRLFVDLTKELASPASRDVVLNGLGRSDPLIRDALTTVIERGDFIESAPADPHALGPGRGKPGTPPAGHQAPVEDDAAIVADLIARSQALIEALKRDIQTKSGTELFDFILEDVQHLTKSTMDPRSLGMIMAAVNASSWLNEKMMEWLDEKNAADALSQSVPNNITSEMGLSLLDVADVIRPHPEVVAYLQTAKDEGFLEGLTRLPGGPEAREAISAYLDKYGMRCVGEIDVTRTRWSESPTTLVPLILGNVKNFEPGAGGRKFEQGRQEASKKERALLDRLKRLPDGDQKAAEAQRMIRRLRSLIGYREYPKYGIVNRYFVYKQALLKEAEELVRANVIHEKADIYYLTFQELREVVRTNELDAELVRQRKDEHELYRKLTPPRVITSDGEIVAGAYKRAALPAEAIVGLPVSSGVVEGRARVLLDMADANLAEGDILVTSFTDPSWTPLFVSIKGLVTEVGGLMTHGAVIAREYGLPAVVGVEHATRLIKDGQRIRVHGTEGYVEILS
ncbi:rifamycin-inactivating phosphotransferase [Polyangium jinanense]|uniref:Prodigiosin synthesizing transferase PigC n=1 Tax=Polyangium jinanense TaxID=2829994 RepID=A0A9X3XK03_9BACT|nr:rifamycin-inactivating phosphotransferase [Polyangium jinanense]MDC3962474.1 phosphoenolpyruvate synthase [Polyangium jinanense]MDC3989576.1 phosphoenolpyruvate synthase [Polyangium jinanense]